jgi:hypothetical protein
MKNVQALFCLTAMAKTYCSFLENDEDMGSVAMHAEQLKRVASMASRLGDPEDKVSPRVETWLRALLEDASIVGAFLDYFPYAFLCAWLDGKTISSSSVTWEDGEDLERHLAWFRRRYSGLVDGIAAEITRCESVG